MRHRIAGASGALVVVGIAAAVGFVPQAQAGVPVGPRTVTASVSASPTPTPTPTPTATPAPASATVALPKVPRSSGTGRRIVYSERTPQHVWIIDRRGRVVRDFPVSGRPDWPRPGSYRVFSKSPRSWSSTYGVSFRWMVRFAHGHAAAIGFHTIPRYPSGRRMHSPSKLGQPVGRGGCPHSADPDAKFLYRWAGIGTRVVVVR